MKMQYAVAAGLIVLSATPAFAASEGTVIQLQPERTWGKGTPAPPEAADRIVDLSPSMRWVSVAYGEKVIFNTVDANGAPQSFAWRFDVSPARSFVDLDDVAPADFPARSVRVFVIGLRTQTAAATDTKATSKKISLEAQVALVCQVVSDWSAFQLVELIRDNAKENQAADPQGMEILRQIRLTEGLASIAFDKLAPEANHDAMYQDAVGKMRLYVSEDGKAADANAKRMVTVCQQTYRRMASEGALTMGEIQAAWDASRESVTTLTEELEAQGYSVQQ